MKRHMRQGLQRSPAQEHLSPWNWGSLLPSTRSSPNLFIQGFYGSTWIKSPLVGDPLCRGLGCGGKFPLPRGRRSAHSPILISMCSGVVRGELNTKGPFHPHHSENDRVLGARLQEAGRRPNICLISVSQASFWRRLPEPLHLCTRPPSPCC